MSKNFLLTRQGAEAFEPLMDTDYLEVLERSISTALDCMGEKLKEDAALSRDDMQALFIDYDNLRCLREDLHDLRVAVEKFEVEVDNILFGKEDAETADDAEEGGKHEEE